VRVSLVLSGGGARGYAHIGVIETLEEMGFEIVSISGTSMGAVIGGVYAAGAMEKYKEWVASLDFLDIFKYLKTPFGLDGEKIFSKIKEFAGEWNIEDLPLKFTAVATDLNRKKEIWFQRGDLWSAVQASSAIPGVFEPVELNGRLLVDGGVLNLMPVAPVMSDMSDIIIAVNLYGKESNIKYSFSKETQALQALFEDVWQRIFTKKEDEVNASINLMMEAIFRYRKAEYTPDIEIEIPQNIAKWYEFHKAPTLIEIGKILAKKNLKMENGKLKMEN